MTRATRVIMWVFCLYAIYKIQGWNNRKTVAAVGFTLAVRTMLYSSINPIL